MALASQPIEIQLVQGADTKSDPKLVDGSRLLALTNGTFDGQGRVAKRPGNIRYAYQRTGAVSLSNYSRTLFKQDSQLVQLNSHVATGEVGQAYALTLGEFAPRGDSHLLKASREALLSGGGDAESTVDLGGDDNYELLAFTQTASATKSLLLTVRDPSTGAAFQSRTSLKSSATVANPRVVSSKGLFYQDAGALKWRAFNTATPQSIGAEVAVVGGISTTEVFDACSRAAGGSLLIYVDIAAGFWKVSIVSAAGVITSTRTLSAFGGYTPDGEVGTVVELSNGNVGVAVSSTVSGLLYFVLSPTLTLVSGGTVIDAAAIGAEAPTRIAAGLDTSDNAVIAYYDDGATGVRVVEVTNAAVVRTAAALWAGHVGYPGLQCTMRLAGQPFYANDGGPCVPVSLNSAVQCTFYVLRGQYSVGARLMAGDAAVTEPTRIPQTRASTNSGYREHILGLPEGLAGGVSYARVVVTGLGDTAVVAGPNIVALDGKSYASGACPHFYDGTSFTEEGFHHYPETPKAADGGAAGALSAGTYQFCALYEWPDEKGILHRSAPSLPVSLTLAAGHKATISIPTLRLTERLDTKGRSPVRLLVFRTLVNQSTFYRTSDATTGLTYIANNAATISINLTDNTSDTAIASNEVLPTTGGALEALPMSAVSFLCVHQDRLFGVSSERDEVVYTSPRPSPGTFDEGFAMRSHTDYVLKAPEAGGAIVALASLDDKLVIFRRLKAYVVYGQGPNRNGLDGTYTDAQPLPGDVGCVDASSVVSTPAGIIFRSRKGFYLLDRSLSIQYVGRDIEAYNSTAVRRALLVPTQSHVRFYLSDGTALVFNYEAGQWARWTGCDYQDACVWSLGVSSSFGANDYVVLLKSNGQVNIELPNYYSEEALTANTPYLLSFDIAWIKPGGIAGFERVRWVTLVGDVSGNLADDPQVRMSFLYDYDDNTSPSDSVTGSAATSASTYPDPILLRHKPARQKCTAIKVRFTELTPAYGTRIAFSAVRLDLGVKRGAAKLTGTRTI